MKVEQKKQALKLRIEQELSLSEISKITKLSKSTLSLLLRDYPLSEEKLKQKNISSRMKGANTNKENAKARNAEYSRNGENLINTNFRDLCLLYWGEGSKYIGCNRFSISNTDKDMIKMIVKIITDLGFIEGTKISCLFYDDRNSNDIRKYWENIINLPVKMYKVKNSKDSKFKRANKQPHGTIRIDVNRVELMHMVLGGIEKIKTGH